MTKTAYMIRQGFIGTEFAVCHVDAVASIGKYGYKQVSQEVYRQLFNAVYYPQPEPAPTGIRQITAQTFDVPDYDDDEIEW